ncbi:hypothetical protein JCM18899A_50710 [Nocardioides sp. AN3]
MSEIATSLGVDRKTIRKYLAPAIEAGIKPGDGTARTSAQWRELAAEQSGCASVLQQLVEDGDIEPLGQGA